MWMVSLARPPKVSATRWKNSTLAAWQSEVICELPSGSYFQGMDAAPEIVCRRRGEIGCSWMTMTPGGKNDVELELGTRLGASLMGVKAADWAALASEASLHSRTVRTIFLYHRYNY